jgi:hypothetical protein
MEAACCEIVHDALPRKRCWRGGRITASQSGAAMLWDIALLANPRWYAVMLATHSATCNGISMHLQSHSEISAPKVNSELAQFSVQAWLAWLITSRAWRREIVGEAGWRR